MHIVFFLNKSETRDLEQIQKIEFKRSKRWRQIAMPVACRAVYRPPVL